jgi:hypothetical protein
MWRATFGIPGFILLLVLVILWLNFWQGIFHPPIDLLPRWRWALTFFLIVGIVMAVGQRIRGRPDGVLIDDRNRVSLANFQAALWTVLIISALITAGGANARWVDKQWGDVVRADARSADAIAATRDRNPVLRCTRAEAPEGQEAQVSGGHADLDRSWRIAGQPNSWCQPDDAVEDQMPLLRSGFSPADINIPAELLLAMGIAATSLAGASAVLSRKSRETADPAAVASSTANLHLAPADVEMQGKVFGLSRAELASWTNMFRGDEDTNAASADMSKIQQFLITMLLVGIYTASLFTLFSSALVFPSLPAISDNFIWLLGISHAGYLAFKAT